MQLGEDGSLLNLQIPPPTETEETTEESSSLSYESGPQEEEGPQDLSQQVQEQTVNSAHEFFGESLGRLKSQLQDERTQFESLAEQVSTKKRRPRSRRWSTPTSLESSLDQSAEDLGLTEDVNQALQQAQQAAGGQQEEEA